jgi:hypothetical protein
MKVFIRKRKAPLKELFSEEPWAWCDERVFVVQIFSDIINKELNTRYRHVSVF